MIGYQKITAIFFLSLFFLLPFVSIKAETYYCACTSGRNCTPGAATEELACQNECATAVNEAGENLYSGNTWHPDGGACGTSVMSPTETTATATTGSSSSGPSYSLTAGTSSTTFANPVLSVNIPTISFSNVIAENGYLEINWLGEYINGLYGFLLSIGGIFAVLMIMIGGIQYVISRGGGEATEAKKRIGNAITGLVLLFSVFIILYTVNPGMISFDALTISTIDPIQYLMESDSSTDNGSGSSGMADARALGINCSGSGDVSEIAEEFVDKVTYRIGGQNGLPYSLEGINPCDGQLCKDFCPTGTLCLDCLGFASLLSQCAGLPAVSGYPALRAGVHISCTSTPGVVKTSDGNTITLTEGDIVGFDENIIWDAKKPDGTEQKLLDVSKIHALGWKYKIELEEGIRQTYEWYKTSL